MPIINQETPLLHQMGAYVVSEALQQREMMIEGLERDNAHKTNLDTLFDEQEQEDADDAGVITCPRNEYELFINDDLTLLMTQAATAHNGITNDETGGVMWGAAICMAQYLTKEMVHGRRTIELGCGGGAPSLVACKYGASHVVATDFELGTLERMAHHAQRNGCPNLDISFLDWAHLPESSEEELNDHGDYHAAQVVMASDVIYGAVNVTAFVQTIDYYLAVGGTFFFATRNGRGSVDKFLAQMPPSGFVEVERVPCNNAVENLRWRGEHTIYAFRRQEKE
jgi:2-polyprenyl-3-methyl-5-hydroxy-6-metoxy-1,4-benzoquinol methylase